MYTDQCHPICDWRPHIIQEFLGLHVKTHNQNGRRRVRNISAQVNYELTRLLSCTAQSVCDDTPFLWWDGVIWGDQCPLRSSELWTDKAVVMRYPISLRRHTLCVVGKTRDFPNLQMNSYFGAFWWLVLVGQPDLQALQQIGIRGYHTFISSSCIWAL